MNISLENSYVHGYWAIRVNLCQHFNTSACAISFFLSWLNPLYNNLTNVLRINLSKYPYQEICSGLCFLGFNNSFWWSISFVYSSATTSSFFFSSLSFLLFFLLSSFLEGVAVLAECYLLFDPQSWPDSKLHFPNMALMWLFKSIAVII